MPPSIPAVVQPLRSAVAAVRSLSAYVGVALWVLLLGSTGLALAAVSRRQRILYALGRGGVRVGLALAGIRYLVAGTQHIQRSRGTVYCVNHTSNLEPPIIFMALAAIHPRLKILYKAELRRFFPVLRNAFDLVGFVPIQRRNRDQSSRAIDGAAAALAGGDSFMVFPEGTRSRTGALLPFKKGGFLMAIRGQAAIVPVAIQGAADAMRKGSPFIRPVTVSVRFGPPIEAAGREVAERDELVARTRGAIEHLLEAGPITPQ